MTIAVHAQPDDHGGSSLHGGHGLGVPGRVGPLCPTVGRRARPRATVPDRGPPCPTVGHRARPWAAVPDRVGP
ncbi:MAG: hypothetical protein H6638_10360 [Ardenticatenales bacterium]|nr:hypothetical protein [Ardenticatenales bacterium]MCB9172083.1 hypothetical protein [Ardenticatenales bacterium]